LADELRREFGASVELVPSSGGVFEVDLDRKRIFSKKSSDRFPDEGEIARLIRAR
jgi:selenoprotein W-related protein